MDQYKILEEIGKGSFGSVVRAIYKQTREVVAIKKIHGRKFDSWEDCLNLPEVKSLRKMNHPNIVKLREVIRENGILYFVFEYMECNLYQFISEKGPTLSEADTRRWCFKVFQGLEYMHRNGYFHRDLKPENLLVLKDEIKIADFGLAREISSQPPYTDYVSTRWYRAPEVLLKSTSYNAAVDMWAMGAIMAEMINLNPIFCGSSEADQMYKICSVLGSPNENSWAEGILLANKINYIFPELPGVDLSALMSYASEEAVSLIASLCSWDPNKRPTAAEVLQHPFFWPCYNVPQTLPSKPTFPLGTPPPGFGTAKPTRHATAAAAAAPLPRFEKPKAIKQAAGAPPAGFAARAPPPGFETAKETRQAARAPLTRSEIATTSLAARTPPPGFGTAKPTGQLEAAVLQARMNAGGWNGQADGFHGTSPNEIIPLAEARNPYSRKIVG